MRKVWLSGSRCKLMAYNNELPSFRAVHSSTFSYLRKGATRYLRRGATRDSCFPLGLSTDTDPSLVLSFSFFGE